jgi:hypothetical protein
MQTFINILHCAIEAIFGSSEFLTGEKIKWGKLRTCGPDNMWAEFFERKNDKDCQTQTHLTIQKLLDGKVIAHFSPCVGNNINRPT